MQHDISGLVQSAVNEPLPLISSRIYALILTSPRLKKILLPAGVPANPYEIMDYQATLFLHDPKGIKATFQRSERIRFLQDGVAAIMDHFWGDGVVLTSYQNDAGVLKDSFRDEGRRHLVIGLKRPMGKGEELTFGVVRTAMVGFTGEEEWLETRIDHPARRLSRGIVFPKYRPCLNARLHCEGHEMELPITALADGRTSVGFNIQKPKAWVAYTIRWSW